MIGFLKVLVLALPFVAAIPANPNHLKIRTPGAKAQVIPGKYIVVFKTNVTAETIQSHTASIVKIKKRDGSSPFIGHKYTMGHFKGCSVATDGSFIAAIAARPEVSYVEPDRIMSATVIPKSEEKQKRALTTQMNSTWGLSRISHRALDTNPYIYDSSGGASKTVYVVDTGIYIEHSEFGGRASWGANFVSTEGETDENGHGTHCSGTIGGSTFGVTKAVKLVAVKVLDSTGNGANSDIIAGMDWVTANATDGSVMSMSIGGAYSAAMNAAADAVFNAGITTVIAAGNNGADASGFSPASTPSAITVGAIDDTDARSIWSTTQSSNYGTLIDIFAPGTNVLSAWIGSTTATNQDSGTSMATPHVAGLAAYLLDLENLASPAAVATRITALATSGLVTDALGSANLIAYNGNGA